MLRFFTVMALSMASAFAAADDTKSPRFLVHLLDYLAKDYGGAVAPGGKLLSPSEYHEQEEFSRSAREAAESIPELTGQEGILTEVKHLEALIAQKGDPAQVSALARQLQKQVTEVTHLEVSPRTWPNLEQGKATYAKQCAFCHGAEGKGDGPEGQNLDPKPANFLDQEHMSKLAPIQAFNTIRLGVPGTGMRAFSELSDAEIWSAAFYVVSLRHAAASLKPERMKIDLTKETLKRVATSSDLELKSAFSQADIANLRLHLETAKDDPLATANVLLDDAFKAYQADQAANAKTLALKAYLEGVEPIEPRLRAVDSAFLAKLESAMADVRATIEARSPPEKLAQAVQIAKAEISKAQELTSQKDLSPTLAFTAASAILLREGFEAVLLILALLGVIRATGSKRAAFWVHMGWIAALALGAIAWIFSGYLMDLSGARREMLEASTSLFAVVVLLVVGFWLHSRTEIGRWNHFLKVKVRSAIDSKNLIGLATISFIAVFREAFETVLFLRAIWLEGGESTRVAMGAGVGITLAVIILGAWAVLRYSTRIPIRRLFAVSAVIMAALAVILTGKGLHSLQESGALGVTQAHLPMRLDLMGVYPTVETLVPQLVVLALSLILWVYGRRPSLRPVRVRTR